MKILVTGATGFIGQHLVKRLIERGDSVSILVRDNSNIEKIPHQVSILSIPDNQESLGEIFVAEKFDGVIHLASLYLMSHKPTDIDNLIDSNIKFGVKVLDAATKAGVHFFVNTSSFMQHLDGRDYGPTNLYAATKKAFQDIAQFYIETTKTIFITLELYNTFGPGDTRPKIFNLWNNAINENKVLDMSPGEQLMDISYIDNIIDGYILAIEHITSDNATSFSGKSYSLMSSERMTLKNLSKVFAEETKGDLKINFGALPYRDRENMTPMDKTPLLPGWSEAISLREGIRRTFK